MHFNYCKVYGIVSLSADSIKQPISVMSLLRQFVDLDLGLQIFLLFSIFVSSFSIFPFAWRVFFPTGFWEARVVGLHGVIALGNAMAALVGFHLKDNFPSKSGLAHIGYYVLYPLFQLLLRSAI